MNLLCLVSLWFDGTPLISTFPCDTKPLNRAFTARVTSKLLFYMLNRNLLCSWVLKDEDFSVSEIGFRSSVKSSMVVFVVFML